jgi:transcriptional regulator with XRE-family HTH domain
MRLQVLIGARIRQLRLINGQSQAQLGALVGIGAPEVSKYENGRRVASLVTLARFAEGLGAPLHELLDVEEETDSWDPELRSLVDRLNEQGVEEARRALLIVLAMLDERAQASR